MLSRQKRGADNSEVVRAIFAGGGIRLGGGRVTAKSNGATFHSYSSILEKRTALGEKFAYADFFCFPFFGCVLERSLAQAFSISA